VLALTLHLLWAKSLVFYEVAYSLYTVSQASRRHWRIGQTDECRVYHLF
jgi:SNF2 family DNA or RNA helicase